MILARVARPYITESRESLHLYTANKAVSCVLGKVGQPRMAPKDEQLMAIQHVLTAYRHIADLQATFVHGVATYPIFLRVIIFLREACRVVVGLLLRRRSIHHCNNAGAFE